MVPEPDWEPEREVEPNVAVRPDSCAVVAVESSLVEAALLTSVAIVVASFIPAVVVTEDELDDMFAPPDMLSETIVASVPVVAASVSETASVLEELLDS